MNEQVKALAKSIEAELIALSDYIYDHPELGYEEFKSSAAHVALLKKYGFEVEQPYLEMPTAFRATYDSKRPGKRMAFLSEYDALPGIGHGCGHNLLGATSTGAGIVAALMMQKHEASGCVVVLGTPAEETSGGKVEMVNRGAFDDIDLALSAHPADQHTRSGTSLAMEAIEFAFHGKTSHAAAAPEKGINALDAVIHTFNGINALRQHILPSARIHGIITEGGKAANIVPDLAIAQFYVRATTKAYLKDLVEKVKQCARAGALATGASLDIRNYEASYDDLLTDEALSEAFIKNLHALGVENVSNARETFGSLDMGNVSHVVPTIHPYFKICETGIAAHTVAFRDATKTPMAYQAMMDTVCALTLTGLGF